jgi:hypothetical protein
MTRFNISTSVRLAVLACTASAACASAQAATITDWDFGLASGAVSSDNTPTPTTDVTGTSAASIIGMLGGPEGDITSIGSPAPGGGYVWRVRGTSANGWSSTAAEYTQGVQFNVNTTGATDIGISFNIAASSNGIANAELEYTTDGINWVQADAVTLTTSYTPQTFALSGVSAAANDPNFAVRLVSAYAPGTSAYAAPLGGTYVNGSGNWRISDFQIDSTVAPVPLPATAWLLLSSMGGLGVFFGRRRAS